MAWQGPGRGPLWLGCCVLVSAAAVVRKLTWGSLHVHWYYRVLLA